MIILFTTFISRKVIVLSYSLLKHAGCTLKNYRGSEVIFGMGIVFVPVLITSAAFVLLLDNTKFSIFIPYLFAVCAIGFAGLLDDLIGIKQVKGLKRHIEAFVKGELTTGFVKAFIGFISSIVISYGISISMLDFILNIFNIALFTNALNLMDLRPGRCIKAFCAIGVIIVISNLMEVLSLLPLIIMLTASLIYVDYDLKEVCMLGDTGSNILGITLGYFSSITFDTSGKVIIFLALFLLNAAAEKFSITKLISNNRFLNYLDNLGRSNG
jgi:UDP-N-acetylmuramyl pentapeptide phosphotransferase/UDP-N-acetylglucosamine-1-phosphate transferase